MPTGDGDRSAGRRLSGLKPGGGGRRAAGPAPAAPPRAAALDRPLHHGRQP